MKLFEPHLVNVLLHMVEKIFTNGWAQPLAHRFAVNNELLGHNSNLFAKTH
jgi:hypothetical protein